MRAAPRCSGAIVLARAPCAGSGAEAACAPPQREAAPARRSSPRTGHAGGSMLATPPRSCGEVRQRGRLRGGVRARRRRKRGGRKARRAQEGRATLHWITAETRVRELWAVGRRSRISVGRRQQPWVVWRLNVLPPSHLELPLVSPSRPCGHHERRRAASIEIRENEKLVPEAERPPVLCSPSPQTLGASGGPPESTGSRGRD